MGTGRVVIPASSEVILRLLNVPEGSAIIGVGFDPAHYQVFFHIVGPEFESVDEIFEAPDWAPIIYKD